MNDASTLQQRVRTIGLLAGPLFAALLYFTLPNEFRAADGTTAPFTQRWR